MDVLNQGLNVMDPTSITFCMDNDLPIVVFDVADRGQPPTCPRRRGAAVPWCDDCVRCRSERRRAATGRLVLDEATGEDGRRRWATPVQEFASVRTGRAAPGLVEKLMVEYYGSEVPLQQLANFTCPRPACSSSPPTTRRRWPPSRRPSATPTSASTPATTARSSGSTSRRSPRSGARTWSSSSSTWPRRAGWRSATLRRAAPPRSRRAREGRRPLRGRAPAGREGARQAHPRPGGRDRRGAPAQGAGAARGLMLARGGPR